MCNNCLETTIRVILSIINTIFLLIGLAVLGVGIFLKISSNKINDAFEGIEFIANLGSAVIEIASIVLIVLGCLIFLISLMGLIGASCAVKVCLIIYLTIISLIFVAHLGGFIFALTKMSALENLLDGLIDDSVKKIKQSSNKEEIDSNCQAFQHISNMIGCCGAKNPDDFDQFAITKCCPKYKQAGCSRKISTEIKKIFIIPNSLLLVFELLIIIAASVLIKVIKPKNSNNKVTPTGSDEVITLRIMKPRN